MASPRKQPLHLWRFFTGEIFLVPTDERFHRLLLLSVTLRVGGLLALGAGFFPPFGLPFSVAGVALFGGALLLAQSQNLSLVGWFTATVLSVLLVTMRLQSDAELLLYLALALPLYVIVVLGRRQGLVVAALLLPSMALLGPEPAVGWPAYALAACLLIGLTYYLEAARLGAARLLTRHANSDPLTRLPNRRAFAERVQAELGRAKRHGHPLSLMFISVDSFSLINTMYGLDAGDRTLIHLTSVLRKVTRRHDVVGRLAGKEFAVLLPETPLEGGAVVAEKVRTAVEESPLVLHEGEVDLSVSLGVVAYSKEMDALSLLFGEAGRLVQEAKRRGGNRVEAG